MGIDIGIFLSGLNRAQDILNRSNQNIANLNTAGYRAVDSLTGGIDFSLSAMMFTGDSFDFGLSGDGFFRVLDSEGNSFYTRNGRFSLDNMGNLVDSEGYRLDTDFRVDPSKSFAVDRQGNVFQDGQQIGQLNVYRFASNAELNRFGGGYYTSQNSPVKVSDPSILSGYQEMSNTDIAKEAVVGIMGEAGYKANLKGIKAMDKLLDETLDILG